MTETQYYTYDILIQMGTFVVTVLLTIFIAYWQYQRSRPKIRLKIIDFAIPKKSNVQVNIGGRIQLINNNSGKGYVANISVCAMKRRWYFFRHILSFEISMDVIGCDQGKCRVDGFDMLELEVGRVVSPDDLKKLNSGVLRLRCLTNEGYLTIPIQY